MTAHLKRLTLLHISSDIPVQSMTMIADSMEELVESSKCLMRRLLQPTITYDFETKQKKEVPATRYDCQLDFSGEKSKIITAAEMDILLKA